MTGVYLAYREEDADALGGIKIVYNASTGKIRPITNMFDPSSQGPFSLPSNMGYDEIPVIREKLFFIGNETFPRSDEDIQSQINENALPPFKLSAEENMAIFDAKEKHYQKVYLIWSESIGKDAGKVKVIYDTNDHTRRLATDIVEEDKLFSYAFCSEKDKRHPSDTTDGGRFFYNNTLIVLGNELTPNSMADIAEQMENKMISVKNRERVLDTLAVFYGEYYRELLKETDPLSLTPKAKYG